MLKTITDININLINISPINPIVVSILYQTLSKKWTEDLNCTETHLESQKSINILLLLALAQEGNETLYDRHTQIWCLVSHWWLNSFITINRGANVRSVVHFCNHGFISAYLILIIFSHLIICCFIFPAVAVCKHTNEHLSNFLEQLTVALMAQSIF